MNAFISKKPRPGFAECLDPWCRHSGGWGTHYHEDVTPAEFCGVSGRKTMTDKVDSPMSDERECLPPDGTEDFTMHWLSLEVGDGSSRRPFKALWTGGMWQTKGIHPLSPRKAAYATWQYESVCHI